MLGGVKYAFNASKKERQSDLCELQVSQVYTGRLKTSKQKQ